jgi:ATP-grasp domain
VRDSFPGLLTSIVGEAPLFCSSGSWLPSGLDLLRTAGLPVPATAISYAGMESYEAALKRVVDGGATLALQHLHAPGEVPLPAHWIPPALVSELNDKANLSRFVPDEFCPPRRVVPIEAAEALELEPGNVIVVKGSTQRSTGAGGAVVIVRRQQQLKELSARLPGCNQVVIEEFQPFVRTMCVTWVATRTGEIHYVGSADQVVDEEGAFQGSWMGSGLAAPPIAVEVGRTIIERGVARGYVGFAGFDMGILPDGRLLVFDLNFRLCTSTPALLWLPVLMEQWPGGCVARLATFRATLPFDQLCRVAAEATRARHLFPLTAFDPATSGWPPGHTSLRGLVTGRNRAETEARCEALGQAGLVTG